MKARTAPTKKLIAAYGLDDGRLSALSLFCDREGIGLRPVSAEETGRTVGEILSSVALGYTKAEDAAECLIFSGFDRQSLAEAVNGLKAAGIRVNLKAAATPSNLGWTLSALTAELAKEHEYMTSRGGAK